MEASNLRAMALYTDETSRWLHASVGAASAWLRLMNSAVQYAVIPNKVTPQTMMGIVRYFRTFSRCVGASGRRGGAFGLIDVSYRQRHEVVELLVFQNRCTSPDMSFLV